MLFVICDIQRDPRNDSGPRAAACAFAPPRAVHHLQASFSTSDGKSFWWAAPIFIFKMKCRLAGTLEPAKERSFVKPNVCDAGGAKDLPFDRIGASSL